MTEQLAEQSTSREGLLNVVAHELRQPISAIRAAIEVFSRKLSEIPESLRPLVSGLLFEMDRLGRLTNRLNYAAQTRNTLTSSARQPVDVVSSIEEVALMSKLEAQNLGVTLICELPTRLPPMTLDKDAFVEIVTNLLENALKYTPRGGRVTISAGENDHHVWIQVSDTGIGLSPAEQSRVFERFYRGDSSRARSPGVGLGLAITRDLVQAHGGTISVCSAPNQGAAFLVELPR
jgi:two-component system phosphate regulon sensor histidine kinase PhoR